MPVRMYDTAKDRGKIQGALHIEDVNISEGRDILVIEVSQRNDPHYNAVYYFGLDPAGKPFVMSKAQFNQVHTYEYGPYT